MEDEKKSYSKISKQIRQEIISKIVYEKQPLGEVASSYSLLPSTCKSIVNTFMKEGRVGKKESRIRKLNKVVTTYNIVLNPINPFFSQISVNRIVENCVEPSIKSRKETEEVIDQPKQDLNDSELGRYIQAWSSQYLQQLNMVQMMESQHQLPIRKMKS